tara:strand:+ start:1884 stop:2633 length:750 start_codon:yes stop_codon:yes gene_type:complete
MKPFKLTVAPNGARLQKSDHPALPISIAEIVACARDCFVAGADEIHLHVRHSDGCHSLDAGQYSEALTELALVVPEMSVQITTESAGVFDVDAQLACLQSLKPSAASISVREMARNADLAKRVYGLCADVGTNVQHILYSPECVTQLLKWRADGTILAAQKDAIFVLGHYNPPVLATPSHLDVFLNAIDGHDITWSACAFGLNEHACLSRAIQMGGHARIGFENNHQSADGKIFADNSASITAFLAQQG